MRRGTDRHALDELTIAAAFSRPGVATDLVGKWHCGAIGEQYHPLKRGFDEFIGFRGGWQDYWDWGLERDRTPVRADGRYLTDVLGDKAVGFILRDKYERFFLHVAFNTHTSPFRSTARSGIRPLLRRRVAHMPPYSFLDGDRTVGTPQEWKTRFLPGQRPGRESPGWDEHPLLSGVD